MRGRACLVQFGLQLSASILHRLHRILQLHRPLNEEVARVRLPRTRLTYKCFGFSILLACLDLRELLEEKFELIAFLDIHCVTPGSGKGTRMTGQQGISSGAC